jgi:hypothetical protein
MTYLPSLYRLAIHCNELITCFHVPTSSRRAILSCAQYAFVCMLRTFTHTHTNTHRQTEKDTQTYTQKCRHTHRHTPSHGPCEVNSSCFAQTHAHPPPMRGTHKCLELSHRTHAHKVVYASHKENKKIWTHLSTYIHTRCVRLRQGEHTTVDISDRVVYICCVRVK